ncbi:hypothetical protein LPJ66_006890, partial [Kickxella alabastrina]
LRTAPLAQCLPLLPLLADYTAEIAKARTPLRKLVAALVLRIEQAAAYSALCSLSRAMQAYLARLFAAYPDAFIDPPTWPKYQAALTAACKGSDAPALRHVGARNRAFSLESSASGGEEDTDRGEPTPLHVLGTLTAAPGFDAQAVFQQLFTPDADTAHLIRILCFWAVSTSSSTGSSTSSTGTGTGTGSSQATALDPPSTAFRTLAAAQLCRMHLETTTDAQGLQAAIIGFLDILADHPNVWAVCLLLERLADAQCFSVARYLQLLTARGDFFGPRVMAPRSQRHLAYVRALSCISEEERSLRRMVLSDADADADSGTQLAEADAEARIRAGIATLLPFMVAYTCAAPVRARAGGRPVAADEDAAAWWMPVERTAQALLGHPAARLACTKEWLAPLDDSALADAPHLGQDLPSAPHLGRGLLPASHLGQDLPPASHLGQDLPPALVALLQGGSRRSATAAVAQVVRMARGFVVKDVEVGEDNWRVITQPGSSLLNRRQAATVARILARALCPGELLDFLLWVLAHSRAMPVLRFAHRELRRHRACWQMMGRTPAATGALQAMAAVAAPFDAEWVRTSGAWAEDAALAHAVRSAWDAFRAQSLPDALHAHTQPSTLAVPAASLAAEIPALARLALDAEPSEAEWAVQPSFQKFARHTLATTASPDQALAVAVGDATAAAMQAATQPPLDLRLLQCHVNVCAQYVRWFLLSTGAVPVAASRLLLMRLAQALDAWAVGNPDACMRVVRLWAAALVAMGLVDAGDAVGWAIDRCASAAPPHPRPPLCAGVAAIAHALGALDRPLSDRMEAEAAWEEALQRSSNSSDKTTASLNARVVDLLFAAARVSGHLRAHGSAHLAAVLLGAVADLAQAPWILDAAARIPMHPGSAQHLKLLDIYRSHVQSPLEDPLVPLPVKRALLRVLLTLCEQRDPEATGFSAMTTAEVAHRLHRTLKNFWKHSATCPVASSSSTATIMGGNSGLSAILNSLLLFASAALQESEATTDALLLVAGANKDGSDSGDLAESNVHFVTDAVAYLSASVRDALLYWDLLGPAASGMLADALVTLPVPVMVRLAENLAESVFLVFTPTGSTTGGSGEDQLECGGAREVGDMVGAVAVGRGAEIARVVRRLVAQLAIATETTAGVPADPAALACLRMLADALLAQLQAIAAYSNPTAAAHLLPPNPSSDHTDSPTSPDVLVHPLPIHAVLWRLQAIQPLASLMREYPEDFSLSQWLTTLVTLSLAPPLPPAAAPTIEDNLSCVLLDFASIIHESLTPQQRKQTLAVLRSVVPLLHESGIGGGGALGRLFPFDTKTVATKDVVGADEFAWRSLGGLEFLPLVLGSNAVVNQVGAQGLEGMTPFTLRGMVEEENARKASSAVMAAGGNAVLGVGSVGYSALVRGIGARGASVAVERELRYLENPYYPMRPAVLAALAETPV